MTHPMDPSARRKSPRGAGGSGWAPMPSSSSRDPDDERWWLDREIDMLENVLRERGELSRDALGNAVGREYWGPGRFGQALREALRRRTITTPARRRYGPR